MVSRDPAETAAELAARYERIAAEREQRADWLDYTSQLLRRVTDCPSYPMEQEIEANGLRKTAWFLRHGAQLIRARLGQQPNRQA